MSRKQLLELGLSRRAIQHREATGRLHPVRRGVFAVGRPELTRYGEWMAAVLACGEEAVLSHETAAALWQIRADNGREIHLSMPTSRRATSPGLVIHRRTTIETTTHHHLPVTTPPVTLVDLAATLTQDELEAAINEADIRNLTTPQRLRAFLDDAVSRPGTGRLKGTLDRRTFRLTRSGLERLFLPIAKQAGLPPPETRAWVNGFEVDFYWPDLGLVVESDGLRYHRTPAEQARDRIRDQTHTAAGLTPLRFTHAQVKFEPADVEGILRRVARRLAYD